MITHLARIDVMIKDKFKPNVFSDERLLHGEGPIWDEKRKLIWVADVHGYRILGFDIDGNIIEDHKLNHKPASFFFSDKYMYVVCMDGIYQFIDESLVLVAGAFCRVQRTPMRFRADAVQSTTDALKQCIFSYSRGFITTV